jgi:predicted metalloprotease
MKWRRARRSSNIEDRRGMRPATGVKVGGGAALFVVVIALLMGGDPAAVLQMLEPGTAALPAPAPTGAERDLLEDGDVEEALNAAAAIGDDRLQRQATGHVVPESFTHGSSDQRVQWFRTGLQTGDVDRCETFGSGAP